MKKNNIKKTVKKTLTAPAVGRMLETVALNLNKHFKTERFVALDFGKDQKGIYCDDVLIYSFDRNTENFNPDIYNVKNIKSEALDKFESAMFNNKIKTPFMVTGYDQRVVVCQGQFIGQKGWVTNPMLDTDEVEVQINGEKIYLPKNFVIVIR